MIRCFRVTRPNRYGPNTPGHTDTSVRQGHYMMAEDAETAKQHLRTRLQLNEDEPLDVQEWFPSI